VEYIDDKIQDLLTKLPSECSCIDYKVVPYDRYKDHEFIRDVIAMLNSEEGLNKEKFIVFGVTNERKLRGIDTTEWRDDNEWQHLLAGLFLPIKDMLVMRYLVCYRVIFLL